MPELKDRSAPIRRLLEAELHILWGGQEVSIIKRIVKETALIPYRVLQGLGAALDEVTGEGKK